MKTISIRHRHTDVVLYTTEVEDSDPAPIRTALQRAISARGNLAGAYLARANLARANLNDANLDGAYLADANLDGAYLNGANLARANLNDANLDGAYLADANLDGADLNGANLDGADLTGANLDGADLTGANLDGAYLTGANLAGADLTGANLARANLAGADLDGAYLTGANLARANLAGANLARADLDGAYLDGAYLDGARNVPDGVTATSPAEPYKRPTAPAEIVARYRERHPEVPVIEQLDSKILHAVTEGGGTLKMDAWHTCETTHCRAGWAIHLAGAAGRDLERQHGPQRAGSMIYRASTGRVPWFFAPNDVALEDIKRCAAAEAATVEP
jgi:uncharacterized protein YjbI with pentapeptide repeats